MSSDNVDEGDVGILYLAAAGRGWGPIDELVALTARMFDAVVTTIHDHGEASFLAKASSVLPRRRGRGRTLLVIAANPALVAYAARVRHWFPGYERTAAWIIDSFWTERISRFAQAGRHFDDIFITTGDLLDEWRRTTRTAVHWAPWGADTLAQPATTGDRPVDLLRLGRQPTAWDDDRRLVEEASRAGIVAEGRPTFSDDSTKNQRSVRAALDRAKFVLAFHNLVSPAAYTHPTRSYLTGRWTDALAAGTTVIGAAPKGAEGVLWPGATVEIDPTDLEVGLSQALPFIESWTPAAAAEQAVQARASIDWRYRLAQISSTLELPIRSPLQQDLARLADGTTTSGTPA